MIEKDRVTEIFEVTCNTCGKIEAIDTEDDWSELMAELKRLGWKTYKPDGGDWSHSCPECFERWKGSGNVPQKKGPEQPYLPGLEPR